MQFLVQRSVHMATTAASLVVVKVLNVHMEITAASHVAVKVLSVHMETTAVFHVENYITNS